MPDQLAFRAEMVRPDFPALDQQVFNRPLVYLDNAATTQKPHIVIERVKSWYELENCNIHRGVHHLSQLATEAFENARNYIAALLNASHSHEIIFTLGTTDSINLVASSFGTTYVGQGDHVLVSGMEHHSNFVPWQQLCITKGATMDVLRITDEGEADLDHYTQLLKLRPKIVAITHISNALGTINPVKEMIRLAHEYGIPVLVDGAQSVAHLSIDLHDLDCDFFAFSGHKVYGPMGVGILYGKQDWLMKMPPYQFGGEMVDAVTIEKTTFNELPFKFEAGTPNVGAVLGLETALRYIHGIGLARLMQYEDALLSYALEKLENTGHVRFIGRPKHQAAVISFLIDNTHPYDAGTIIDKLGVAVRTGHHCAQPLMQIFGIPGTIRASFGFYNTFEEVDILADAVKKAAHMLA
jgi:cysteine desulfurase / selenocysteine lyase